MSTSRCQVQRALVETKVERFADSGCRAAVNAVINAAFFTARTIRASVAKKSIVVRGLLEDQDPKAITTVTGAPCLIHSRSMCPKGRSSNTICLGHSIYPWMVQVCLAGVPQVLRACHVEGRLTTKTVVDLAAIKGRHTMVIQGPKAIKMGGFCSRCLQHKALLDLGVVGMIPVLCKADSKSHSCQGRFQDLCNMVKGLLSTCSVLGNWVQHQVGPEELIISIKAI